MKKLTLIIASVIVSMPLLAQDLRPGVRGGLNLASQRVENMPVYFNNAQSRLAWQAGIVAELAIDKRFAVQPALLLSSKGTRFASSYTSSTRGLVDYDIRYQPLYLHLPIPVLMSGKVAGLKIFGGLGPYVSMGWGGRAMARGNVDVIGWDSSENRPLRWGNGLADDYRRMDAGFLFMLGIEPRAGVQIAIIYEQGLANIAPSVITDRIIRHRVPALTASFFLPR